MEVSETETGMLASVQIMGGQDWLVVLALSAAVLPLLSRRASHIALLAIAPLAMMALRYSGHATELAALLTICALLLVIAAVVAQQRGRADRLEARLAQLDARLNALEMAEARIQNFTAHSFIAARPEGMDQDVSALRRRTNGEAQAAPFGVQASTNHRTRL